MAKLDKDTYNLAQEQKKFKELVDSDGWKEAKATLMSRMADMTSVMNIVDLDPSKVVVEIGARQLAQSILLEWIADIEGTAEQYKHNVQPVQQDHPTFIKEVD